MKKAATSFRMVNSQERKKDMDSDVNPDDDALPSAFVAFLEERRVQLMKHKQDSPEQREAMKRLVDQFITSYFDTEEIEKIKPKLQFQLLEYIKEYINNNKSKNPPKFQWRFPRNLAILGEKKTKNKTPLLPFQAGPKRPRRFKRIWHPTWRHPRKTNSKNWQNS